MKILYFGGQKSGKSLKAEEKTLELCSKPYYIATYDNSYNDKSMQNKIDTHKIQRNNKFILIEEPKNLKAQIQLNNTYLIDCLSMWILNNISENKEFFLTQLDSILKIDANIIFVLNDVNSGIIPIESQTRKFIDLTGIIGAKIASLCNEVYEIKFGLENKLK